MGLLEKAAKRSAEIASQKDGALPQSQKKKRLATRSVNSYTS